MRKIILFFVFLIVTVSVFAATPAWVVNPYAGYDSAKLICATGYGKTIQDADLDAKAGIAGFFGTSIVAATSTSTMDAGNGNNYDVFTSSAASAINVEDIVGIDIDVRYEMSNGSYVSHAILKKASTMLYYGSQANLYKTRVENLQEMIIESVGTFSCMGLVDEIEQDYSKYLKCVLLYNALSITPLEFDLEVDTTMLRALANSGLAVVVEVKGDVSGRFETAIKKVLTDCGYEVSRKNGRNTILAEVSFENAEVKGSPYKFVYYTINISVSDDVTDKELLEFSKTGREAHTSYASAKTRSVSAIEKLILNNFSQDFKSKFKGE